MAVACAGAGAVMEKCCRCLSCLKLDETVAAPGVFESGFKVVVTMCARCRDEWKKAGRCEIRYDGMVRTLKTREEKKR